LAWPIVTRPASTSAWISRESSSSRRWFAIDERSMPTRWPISSCVAPVSARRGNATASSIGFRSRRCNVLDQRDFEPIARIDLEHDAGIDASPASFDARQRRSPTTSS
jgi:hypothetical protein